MKTEPTNPGSLGEGIKTEVVYVHIE